ncbi:phage holin family protein [Fructilactobacillus cliffordii]|uniref:phage holin n=1 Tax=Fructilactobacillus cliffordii TaxID=2940299 RepID=UPI0020938A0A|nr:phage holin [Fructilactobacillus cliffordii]USS86509.1 phage holin family protein [Fructilactobacillus cliffordii]
MMEKVKRALHKTALINDEGKIDGSMVVSLVLLSLIFIQQLCNMFGLELPVHQDQVMGALGTLLTIGVMLGIVYDYNGNQGGPKNGNKN